jgi:GeoRSP system SPASM domain protein
MNLKELTWPVRIYWDLPEHAADPGRLLAVAREIVELKVLFLSLRDAAAPVSPACLSLIDSLTGKNIALSLTIPGRALTPQLPGTFSRSSVRALLTNVTSLAEARRTFPAGRGAGVGAIRPGISFDISRENYREIPEVVSFCLESGISDLVFPIQRHSGTGQPFCFTTKERNELEPRIAGLAYRSLRITIHDPFLWPVFYPEKDYHEGGCQAANSMLYIAPDLTVTPCPAMPLPLGDLKKTTLREIILSDRKRELRKSLLAPPGACASCGLAAACLGGCRGRTFAAGGSLDGKDPACA